jgi:hypothetical protein
MPPPYTFKPVDPVPPDVTDNALQPVKVLLAMV